MDPTTDHVGFPGPVVEKKSRENQALDYYQKGVELAHSATTHEDHIKAIELFSLAISIRPNHARYFLARGNSFRSINEHESAVTDFTYAIELDNTCATYYANRGASYRKLSMPADALEDLTIAIELDVKKGLHYFNRALVLYDASYFREAIQDFTRALAEGSSGNARIEFRALHSRGNCHRRMGNLKSCVDDLVEAIKLEPRNPVGYNALAQCYMEFGDIENGIKNFTSAVNLQDSSATYLNNRGQALFRKGQESYRSALIDFHAAVKLDGKDAQAYYNRGITRLAIALLEIKCDELELTKQRKLDAINVGDSEEEAAAITRPVAPSPPPNIAEKESNNDDHDPESHSVTTTGVMNVDEQLEAAIADLDMACALAPSSTRYMFGKAMVVHMKNIPQEETLEHLQAALDIDPSHVASMYHLGMLHHSMGDFKTAIKMFTDIIHLVPSEHRFYHARGLAFQEIEMHDLAIEDYTNAIQNSPQPEYYHHRGESHLRFGNFQLAAVDFTAAIELKYSIPEVFNGRGLAYRGLRDYDAAIVDLIKCIDLNKRHACFRLHRALCYYETLKYHDAHSDLKIGLKIAPKDARILYYYGLTCFHLRTFQDCIDHLKIALEHSPTKDTICDLHYHIGLAHACMEQHIQSIEFYTNAINMTTDRKCRIKYLHERAKALQMEGYYEEAVVDFSEVIENNPTNSNAYFRRGFAYKALGELKLSAADIEKAKMLDPMNPRLMVNYKNLHDTECIILCEPGQEVEN